jgi:predicted membrane GTPase involved in stress response
VLSLRLHRLTGFSATSGMIGIRSALLTATKGTVVLDTQFDSYKPCVGIVAQREKGSLLAHEQGNRAAAVRMYVVLLWCAGCVECRGGVAGLTVTCFVHGLP